MRFTCVFVFIASLMACKGDAAKSGGDRAGGAGSDKGGMNMGSNPAGVIPKEEGVKLTCDNVMPPAVRDKFFKDFDVTDNAKSNRWEGECNIKSKTDPGSTGIVMANCNKQMNTPEARTLTIEQTKKLVPDMKDLDGVGVKAMQSEGQVTVFGESCFINVNAPKGVDAVAVAKELLPLLPPK